MKPTVFISHRHADKAVAKVVASFLDERTAGAANIFCSSSADHVQPTAGDSLEVSLKHALGMSDVVVLVFTSDTEDWSFCMWECGVATDPADKRRTKVVVLQCYDAVPKPYGDHVRVDVRSLESITGFVKTILTTIDYFPSRNDPLTGFGPDSQQIREFAQELHTKLGIELAGLCRGEVEERCAAPYLRLELDAGAIAELRSDGPAANEVLRSRCRVVESREAAALLEFQLDGDISLGSVFDKWVAMHGGQGHDGSAADNRWIESVTDQALAVIRGRLPLVAWAPIDVMPGKAIIPIVSGSRTVPTTGSLQLQLYFVSMSPRPVRVAERMIGLGEMFHKNLSETPGESIQLAVLANEMKADGRSRVPLLGEGNRPRFIVHRGMIQEFIADRALNGDADVKSLTVHDLLVDGDESDIFEQSFAIVDRQADMDHALAAMNAKPGCQDVFVTVDGTPDGAVLGWLTNTMFTT